MEPQFVAKPAFTVVGLLIHTSPKAQEIPALWQQFGPRMNEVKHVTEPGVSYGLMNHFDRSLGKLDYMACEAVDAVADVPAGMTSLEVPANTYAVFETTLATTPNTFDHIFGTWLPTSGYQQVAAPYFEYYNESFNPDNPASKLSIYVPVTKM